MFLTAFLLASTAHSAPLKFDEVTVGGSAYIQVVTRVSQFAKSDKTEASLAVGPDGKVAVAWQSRRQLNGLSGVYSRVFELGGAALGAETRVSTQTRFHEFEPSVVLTDKPLVFLESAWRDDSGTGIFAGDQLAATTVRGDQNDVVAARLGDGRILAVWSSQISRKERRLFGRLFDSAGKPVGAEFRVTGVDSGNEVVPSLAVGSKGIAVAWQQTGAGEGIWATTFAPGKLAKAPVRVAGATAFEPSFAAARDGYVIGWTEATAEGRHRAKAAVLDRSLTLVSELSLPAQPGYQNATSVAADRDGKVAVAWNRADSLGEKEIHFRVFDKNGAAAGGLLHKGALAEATGRTRISFSKGVLFFAWSGDAGLGDTKAVHLTQLMPKASVSAAMLREMAAAAKAVPISVAETKVEVEEEIQFVSQAGPHEPPTYNPKSRLDPWGENPLDGGGSGFNAVISTGWTPPDPHMAVGPNAVGVMTNGQIAFFTKGGRLFFRDEIEDSFGFWGSLGATNFVFDPEVVYDDMVDRWFAMACERAPGSRSYFLLAVSDDSDPNGTWFKYRIDVTALAGGDIDSPNISTDENAVYLSADFFSTGDRYLIYILDKDDLIVGDPTPTNRSHMITGPQSHGMPMTMDAGAPQYLIEHFEATTNTTVRLHAITDPLGTPVRTSFVLNVPSYGRPENPPQGGTSVRPTAFDSRFWSCVYRNGSLWATHHVNSSRVVARWYEIKMNNWPNGGTPELVQSGSVDPGGTVRTSFSSIAVDANGNAAVVCARSSPTEFLSMYRAIRKFSDPLGTMPDAAIVKSSDSPYFTSRWGDYSGAVVDPADNRTFWGHHEYSEAGLWRTWVGSFAADLTTEERPTEQIIPILSGAITGGLPEIASADGSVMVINPASFPRFSEIASRVDFTTTGTVANLAELAIRVVAKSGSGSGKARISLFNRTTGVYDVIGESDLNPSTFTTFTSAATPNVNRYMDAGTKEIRVRVEMFVSFLVSPVLPAIHIDEIKFVTKY